LDVIQALKREPQLSGLHQARIHPRIWLRTNDVHEHGRKVAEIMTPEPLTITEDTPLEEIVALMEKNNVKRLPVARGDQVVGIVSRANLVQGLVGMIDAALRQAESGARSEAVTLDIAARIESLSPRERQVMDGLIAGLSNKLIAREYDISPRTIEVYRANVMTKMQAGSLSELVRLAMRAGALKD
jgi:DNA-binding NarL/FixJ family response regulator